MFAKPIQLPRNDAEGLYTTEQEAIRKDFECCFCVLQARFDILRHENKRWDVDEIVRISEACVIVHKMLASTVVPWSKRAG